jgi:hypothetical protein
LRPASLIPSALFLMSGEAREAAPAGDDFGPTCERTANIWNARKSVHTIRYPTSSLVAETPGRRQFHQAADFTVLDMPGLAA